MEKIEGSVLSCHNIQYTVDVKPPGKPCAKREAKQIIRGVNGIFKSGVNAIMGPTGSGKTSLLDILAGRKDKNGLTGELLIDGKKQPKNFKCKTGYVVQDDMVMGTLSVRENLTFSANVRLSKHISHEEKEARIDAVIRELGLTHCEDTKIGNQFLRGVSGGERKRTNIGMELIISPSVLFLDEPTTGLDASTANAVMLLLNRLGRKGRVIILSIHQPRYSIYRMFDRLMLLALGKTVYHGPSDETLRYFSFLGHECEAHNNPADFFLDVINGDSSAVLKVDNIGVDASNGGGDLNEIPMVEIGDGKESSLAEELSRKYSESEWGREVTKELAPIYDSFQRTSSHDDDDVSEIEYATGFPTQFKHLCIRTTRNVLRNPQTSVMQLLTISFFGLIVGTLYFQVDESAESGLQNRLGAFFFIIMNSLFSNMPTVELFISERDIFIHENGGGFYRVSAYYLSKVVCDIIPLRIIPTLFYCLLIYFMIGFELDAAKFFIFTLNVILTTLTGASIGFFYSSCVNIFAVAQLFISLTYIVMLLFGGLMVNLETIWEGIRWLKWFSLFRYSFNAFCVNELKDLMFYSNGTEVGYLGEEFMDNAGIPYETDWDLWLNEFALGMMTLGFLSLTYVMLLRMKKYK